MDFSLLSPLEFFADPKNGDGRNNKPPAIDMIMKIKQNKNAIRILAKLSIDFLCIIPYTYYE